MSKALFVTRDDLVKKSLLGGNVDLDKVLQYVELAQDMHIQTQLGTDLYEKLQADIIAGTLAGNYQTLVRDYIKPMLIHYAASEYLLFISYEIGNAGVTKHTPENAEVATNSEVSFLADKERQYAEFYTERFNAYMTYNAATLFPEFYTNSNGDMRPERTENHTSWVL